VPRHLQDEIAARLVHPVEHNQMRAALYSRERRRVTRINFEGAHGVGFTRVLGTFLPAGPGGPHPADEIDPGIALFRQRDGDLAGPDAELFVLHAVLHFGWAAVVGGAIPQFSYQLLA